MVNALRSLLEIDPSIRRVDAYEGVFDDFIAFSGGCRVTDIAQIAKGVKNADYVLEADEARLIIELKQISKYDRVKSVDEYFSDLLRQGRIISPPPMGSRKLHIGPGSLSPSEWTRFHREFRPRIPKSLDTAARQIKATPKILPLTTKRTIGVAILVNTGDYNLPVDLMFRIVERHAKAKWKVGRFSSLDAILCLSMDMLKNGQHPLHGRAIARDAADKQVAGSAHYLFDRWVHYGAAAVGASVQFTPGLLTADPFQLGGGIDGKIRLV